MITSLPGSLKNTLRYTFAVVSVFENESITDRQSVFDQTSCWNQSPGGSPVVFISRLFAQLHDRRLSLRQCVPRNSGPLEDQPEQTPPPTTAPGAGIFSRCHVCQRDRPSDKDKLSAVGSTAMLFARHSRRHFSTYDLDDNPAERNQTFCYTD